MREVTSCCLITVSLLVIVPACGEEASLLRIDEPQFSEPTFVATASGSALATGGNGDSGSEMEFGSATHEEASLALADTSGADAAGGVAAASFDVSIAPEASASAVGLHTVALSMGGGMGGYTTTMSSGAGCDPEFEVVGEPGTWVRLTSIVRLQVEDGSTGAAAGTLVTATARVSAFSGVAAVANESGSVNAWVDGIGPVFSESIGTGSDRTFVFEEYVPVGHTFYSLSGALGNVSITTGGAVDVAQVNGDCSIVISVEPVSGTPSYPFYRLLEDVLDEEQEPIRILLWEQEPPDPCDP